jgi:hypothetical protein
VIAKGHDRVLIFEDDIRFEPFFVAKLETLLAELDGIRDKWDLVFLGKGLVPPDQCCGSGMFNPGSGSLTFFYPGSGG